MAGDFLYFAYGSNLLSQRLRLRTASAVVVGNGVLRRHALRWHMASTDGSGKCDVVAQGDAGAALVHGVVYRIDQREKHLLDSAESLGVGYREEAVSVELGAQRVMARIYIALRTDTTVVPYDWYHALVLGGAREHRLPADYVRQLAAVPTRPDPDLQRAALHFALVDSSRGSGRESLSEPPSAQSVVVDAVDRTPTASRVI